jgi:hypothetical protein
MSDFDKSWKLSRGRLVETISKFNQAQLNWRIHPQALTIGEMVLHVAGVELSFATQLTGKELDAAGKRLKLAATDGVVNDSPFPFSNDEITPEFVAEKLAVAYAAISPLMEGPIDEVAQKQIVSALGPVVTGDMALVRLSFHPAYHHGQAYLISVAPGFPA